MKVQCARHHWYNTKFNNRCPHCGSREVLGVANFEPVAPEALAALKKHFNGQA